MVSQVLSASLRMDLPAVQLDNDLAVAVVIDLLELADVAYADLD